MNIQVSAFHIVDYSQHALHILAKRPFFATKIIKNFQQKTTPACLNKKIGMK